MAKKQKNISLNIKGLVEKKIDLDDKTTYDLRYSNFKINEDLNSFLKQRGVLEDKGLSNNIRYIIRGGSSISGCPMHHSVNTKNPVRIFNKKRGRKTTVCSKYVTSRTRVLDILAK